MVESSRKPCAFLAWLGLLKGGSAGVRGEVKLNACLGLRGLSTLRDIDLLVHFRPSEIEETV